MATTTSGNMGLTKPEHSDQAEVSVLNGNMDIIDETVTALEGALAIVATGTTAPRAISSGQFVLWQGAMYVATAAIASGATLSSSNLSAVPAGTLNTLKSNVDSNASAISSMGSTLGSHTSTLSSHTSTLNSHGNSISSLSNSVNSLSSGKVPVCGFNGSTNRHSTNFSGSSSFTTPADGWYFLRAQHQSATAGVRLTISVGGQTVADDRTNGQQYDSLSVFLYIPAGKTVTFGSSSGTTHAQATQIS